MKQTCVASPPLSRCLGYPGHGATLRWISGCRQILSQVGCGQSFLALQTYPLLFVFFSANRNPIESPASSDTQFVFGNVAVVGARDFTIHVRQQTLHLLRCNYKRICHEIRKQRVAVRQW